MHDEHNLAPLISRALQGEEAAINELIGQIRPYLHLLSRQQVDLAPSANLDHSDIVQETLLHIHQGLRQGPSRFEGHSPPQFLAWIRVIQQRVIQDFQRRGRAQKRDLNRISTNLQFLAASLDSGLDEVQQMERAARLASALESLPTPYRDVVQLRIFDQLSYQEISRLTGRTDAALRVMFVRAIAALRKHPDLQALVESGS